MAKRHALNVDLTLRARFVTRSVMSTVKFSDPLACFRARGYVGRVACLRPNSPEYFHVASAASQSSRNIDTRPPGTRMGTDCGHRDALARSIAGRRLASVSRAQFQRHL